MHFIEQWSGIWDHSGDRWLNLLLFGVIIALAALSG
jgi:hypothetical protein